MGLNPNFWIIRLLDPVILCGLFLVLIAGFSFYKYKRTSKKKSKRIIIIIAVSLSLISLLILYSKCYMFAFTYRGPLFYLTQSLKYYIQENDGRFPESEKDLFNQKFVKRDYVTIEEEQVEYIAVRRSTKHDYDKRQFNEDEWRKCPTFEEFKIRYGTKAEDIMLFSNNLLYDSNDLSQILLIDGPYKKKLDYEYYSFELYTWMLKEKLKHIKGNNEMLRFQQDKSSQLKP